MDPFSGPFFCATLVEIYFATYTQLRTIVKETVKGILSESAKMSLSEKVYSILADEAMEATRFQSARLSKYGITDERVYQSIETACRSIAEAASDMFAEYEQHGQIKPPFKRGGGEDYEQIGF